MPWSHHYHYKTPWHQYNEWVIKIIIAGPLTLIPRMRVISIIITRPLTSIPWMRVISIIKPWMRVIIIITRPLTSNHEWESLSSLQGSWHQYDELQHQKPPSSREVAYRVITEGFWVDCSHLSCLLSATGSADSRGSHATCHHHCRLPPVAITFTCHRVFHMPLLLLLILLLLSQRSAMQGWERG